MSTISLFKERTPQEFEQIEAAKLENRYSQLEESFTGVPYQDFGTMLSFYQEITFLSPRTSPIAQEGLQTLVQKVERWIATFIDVQKENETNQTSLQKLKNCLEAAAVNGDRSSPNVIAEAQGAFSALPLEIRKFLFEKVNNLLDPTTQPNLTGTIQRELFLTWPGTYAQKLAILDNNMPLGVVAAATMRQQFERAQRIAPQVQQPQDPSTRITASTPVMPQQQQSCEDKGKLKSSATLSVEALLAILPHLQDNATSAILPTQALEQLDLIASYHHTSAFRINASPSSLIADRSSYHLYLIHKNERSRLPNDMNYGHNAMIGLHPASHCDRRRAILRTIAELALESLDQAIQSADASEMLAMLHHLESLELDERDLPQGDRNIAHNLFGKMYHLHQEVRQENPSLVDPHDSRFGGDFGRKAFITSAQGVDLKVKRAAIQEMLNALKAAWKP